MELDYISRDGGASESIGFLLIFTIVIMGIGLVTLYGYPLLLQQQTGADEQIMEKNMIVLQNDFKSLAYKTVPYKETALKIGGGSLDVNTFQSTGPTFTISDSSGDLMPANMTGDLRYRSSASQAEISLENGAVVKRDPTASGSIMLAQPRWFYDETTGTMVINVICVNASKYIAREGIGTVQMQLGPTDYIKQDYASPGSGITIRYSPTGSSDYQAAWENYFEKTLGLNCGGSSPMVCNTPAAYVRTIVIKRTEVIISNI